MACFVKKSRCYSRVKQIANVGVGGSCSCVCTFYLLVFKLIMGLLFALVSKWPITRNRLPAEQNRVKLESNGQY